jgi:nucleotide-binding universal stress UspA family protein
MRDEARIEEGRRQMDQLLGHFTLQCAQAGIAAKILEDFGQPAEQILLESQRYDLILIGRETRWNWKASIDAEQTQLRLIQHSPRPVVIVPQHIPLHANILIAYDGSLPAARAIAAFQASHLGESHLIHILSVSEDVAVAARSAERASDYLTHHGLTSTSHRVVSSHPATAILEFAAKIQAGLLVMGAYGKPLLHDFFLGSTTRDLIAKSTAPIFLCH